MESGTMLLIILIAASLVAVMVALTTKIARDEATKEAREEFENEAVEAGFAFFDQKTKEFTWLKGPGQ